MYGKFVNALYLLNIIFQAFFDLVFPIGVSLLVSWLLVDKASAPGWIYAPLVVVGVIIGFSSMIRFILAAAKTLERLERERGAKTDKGKEDDNAK